jgi:hypothetical protein
MKITLGALGSLGNVHASLVNQTFYKFIERLPKARSDLKPPDPSTPLRMELALKRLAELMDDDKMVQRNYMSALSFSCVTPDIMAMQYDMIREYRRGMSDVLSPVGPDGRPYRK